MLANICVSVKENDKQENGSIVKIYMERKRDRDRDRERQTEEPQRRLQK